MTRMLIVDDEPKVLSLLQRSLRPRGFEVHAAESGEEALQRAQGERYDVVLCDYVMQGLNGLGVYDGLRKLDCPPAFVMMTGFSDVLENVPSSRRDFHVVTKPFGDFDALTDILRAAVKMREHRPMRTAMSGLTWTSIDANQLRNAARTDEIIMIFGESGVGKTRLAREVHRLSSRADGPFLEQNCAELTPGLAASVLFGHVDGAFTDARGAKQGSVEAAASGTLFLDEIGDLDLKVQGMLLRFLQSGSYQRVGEPTERQADVRVIAATNRDLKQLVAEGRFREDLLYRLAVVEMTVEPLRQRREDIPRLVEVLRRRVARAHGKEPVFFSARAMEALQAYTWPGNIRELENLIRRVSATQDPNVAVEPEDIGDPIARHAARGGPSARSARGAGGLDDEAPSFAIEMDEREDLPSLTAHHGSLKDYLAVLEYRALLLGLRDYERNASRVAREFGYGRSTMLARIDRLKALYGVFPPL